MRTQSISAAIAIAFAGSAASGAIIDITIENTQSSGGFSFTPFWLGVHDGSFDVFDAGASASGGITEIAELGDTSVLSSRFASEEPGGVDTTFAEPNGPPVFSPGESATTSIDVGDETTYRFLNYASMVVPTNDLFVGNDNAIELFDAAGNFLGPITIDIFGSSVWDNGTEVNDASNGPAFTAGQDATDGADEGGVITAFFSDANADSYLQSIVGATTPAGEITTTFDRETLLGRITIVPGAPTAGVMLFGLGAAARRRR